MSTCLFGVPVAVISPAHSYLVLAFVGWEKAAEDESFNYTANAAGRFKGRLLLGLLIGLSLPYLVGVSSLVLSRQRRPAPVPLRRDRIA